jgi:hypothetical protein
MTTSATVASQLEIGLKESRKLLSRQYSLAKARNEYFEKNILFYKVDLISV